MTQTRRRRKQSMLKKNYVYTKVKDAAEKFFKEKKANNLSEDTLQTYRLHINHFLTMESLDYGELPTSLISIDDYQEWIEVMQEDEGKSDVTIASYARTIRVFLYWLMDNGLTEDFQMKIPKFQATVKVCYTEEELKLLLKKPTACSEVEYQTWVFINLVCATGLRLSSALNLKVSDLVTRTREIYIQKTKNKQAQVLYMSDEMIKIMNEYIKYFELIDEDYLFCTAEKTRLAKRTMQDNVATYNRARGVEKTSIHLMRHTYAKNYYNQTKDIYSLCKILGHSSVAITENYLRDLGLSVENALAYNPQQQFAIAESKVTRKRRGKMNK